MKATEQYFSVVLFIMLYKVVLTFESVGEILKCDHSNEIYWAILSCGTVYYAVQGGSNCWVCGWNPKVWPFKWNLLSNTFLWHCLLWSSYHSNETATERCFLMEVPQKGLSLKANWLKCSCLLRFLWWQVVKCKTPTSLNLSTFCISVAFNYKYQRQLLWNLEVSQLK